MEQISTSGFGSELSAVSDPSELTAAVDVVTAALRRHGVHYFITGSVASSMHGIYRATNDVDIVAELTAAKLPELFDELSVAFVADVDQASSAIAAGVSFNLIHRATFLKVDVFPLVTAFDRETARRAATVTMPGSSDPIAVATKEDILLSKLRWYRLGDESSEVQRRDIRGLIDLNRGELDLEHMRRWATTLGVDDLLSQFLST
jgi:hypothetical protein